MVFIRLQHCASGALAKCVESRSRCDVLQMSTAFRRRSQYKPDSLRSMLSNQSKSKLWWSYAGEMEDIIKRSNYLQDVFCRTTSLYIFWFHSMWWSFVSGSASSRISLHRRTSDRVASQESLQKVAWHLAKRCRKWVKEIANAYKSMPMMNKICVAFRFWNWTVKTRVHHEN